MPSERHTQEIQKRIKEAAEQLLSSPSHQEYKKEIATAIAELETLKEKIAPCNIDKIIATLHLSLEYAKKLLLNSAEYHVLAMYDNKTELPLRGYFDTRLKEILQKMLARETYKSVTVLYIDSDGLKKINDQYGHAQGDEFILEIAKILPSYFRPGDTICRDKETGDEFLVLLTDCDNKTMSKKIEFIEYQIQQHFKKDSKYTGSLPGITIGHSSFHLSQYKNEDITKEYLHNLAEKIIDSADRSMNKRKFLKGKR